MTSATPDLGEARELAAYIDASPTPFHACATAAAALDAAGFQALDESASWSLSAGDYYVHRGGSLVAWSIPETSAASTGFRILGAHTDSPNLRVKPRPDTGRAGLRQLGVEVYGGVLLNSWLNRDLGLAGRVWLRSSDAPGGSVERLFRIDRPLLTVPQLAIHLHREIREAGLQLNPQQHMAPIWAGALIGAVWGVWDFIKNVSEERDKAANWALEWVGAHPGKRWRDSGASG